MGMKMFLFMISLVGCQESPKFNKDNVTNCPPPSSIVKERSECYDEAFDIGIGGNSTARCRPGARADVNVKGYVVCRCTGGDR
jgi:hypothetical protein